MDIVGLLRAGDNQNHKAPQCRSMCIYCRRFCLHNATQILLYIYALGNLEAMEC